MFDKSKFKTQKEMIDFLVKEKDSIISLKKAEMKRADGISVISDHPTTKAIDTNKNELFVKAIINTTNVIDSHDDLHVSGLWDKSIKENGRIKHLQEHQMSFDKIIADKNDLQVYAQDYKWSDLGYNLKGTTQALVFDSNVHKSRNEYMFDQYNKGNVDNHSVGMMYVKIALAVNDKDYKEEFAAWEKYSPMVANEERLDQGFFFAVTEAKVIEGSAVPMGSNTFTPTLETKEPGKPTQHMEPSSDTLKAIIRDSFKSLKI